MYYGTDTSYYEKIPAGETNAVIKALNNGRTAIRDLPDGYAAKDWTSDANGYPTLNFTSTEDNTAPLVYGASTAVVLGGAVSATCNKNGTLYLVPKPASAYTQKSELVSAAAAGGMTMFCTAGVFRSFLTTGLTTGTYQIYAVDKLGQLSLPSSNITLYADSAWDGTSASYGWYGTGRQTTFYLSTAADLKGFANMFAAVIGRLYARSYGISTSSSEHAFTDVDYDGYYGGYVDWAYQNGIIKGTGKEVFEPDREITREEMAAIIYRFAGFLKISGASGGIALNYSDASSIDVWAQEAALYCQESGIITGRENGSFAPKETATRAEVAAILQRFIETAV